MLSNVGTRRAGIYQQSRSEISSCGARYLGDSGRSSKPEARRRKVNLRCAPRSVRRGLPCRSENQIMKPELVQAASEVITNPQILVNMVSRRVRQLTLGHRPLVACAPGLREADIALTEIANGKLTFESTFGENETAEAAPRGGQVPEVAASKKVKKAA